MENLPIFIVAIIILTLNLFLSHMRVAKWISDKLRWIISSLLFISGLLGFVFSSMFESIDVRVFATLCTPFVLTIFDTLMVKISIWIQGRNFYFNTSFESWIDQYDEDFSTTDHFMTVILLLANVALIIISGVWGQS